MMTISREDYDHLMKLPVTPTAPLAHSSHHTSTSCSDTSLLASSTDSWIIDSGAFAHMSSTQSLLTHLSKLSQNSSISIVYGRACSIVGHSEANLTSSLQLSQVIYNGYYVAYKPITLSCIFFMFIEMIFIPCHSCVMFAMKSMSMCND